VVVRRFPTRKVLRAHLLGLTFGLLLALLILCLNYTSLCTELPWHAPISIGLIIIIGTYFGGPFVFIVVLLQLFTFNADSFVGSFQLVTKWYLIGYAFGFILATLYNDLVYLYLLTFCKDRVKIAFAFDFDKKINIIKSPKPKEEKSFEKLLEENSELEKRKLYKFDIDYPNEKYPYTIVFVANPKILKLDGDCKQDEDYDVDPIMKNRELFLRSIDRALYSFERDEVLGRREIWAHVRIVAMFDKTLASASGVEYGMLQPYQNLLLINGKVAENLIDPMEQMQDNFIRMVDRETEESSGLSQAILDDIKSKVDVIFAMSASEEYTRSTAHFSDWKESSGVSDIDVPGDTAKFHPDPFHDEENPKGDDIKIATYLKDHEFKAKHEYHASLPGRVALNVIKANTKSFIHEFAHAMSSAYHGAIVDEYFDTIIAKKDANDSAENSESGDDYVPFFVNRLERVKQLSGKVVPVHKIFVKYDHLIYKSDRNHPSAKENWLGYFPERQALYTRCTMDRGYTDYCFDKLIHHFMYDRLIAKINR